MELVIIGAMYGARVNRSYVWKELCVKLVSVGAMCWTSVNRSYLLD